MFVDDSDTVVSLNDCRKLCEECGLFKCRFCDTEGCPNNFKIGTVSFCVLDCLYFYDFHMCRNLGDSDCTICRLLQMPNVYKSNF